MLLYDIYLLFLFRLKCFVSFWWEQVIQFAVNKGIKYYTLYIDVEKWRKRFSSNGLEENQFAVNKGIKYYYKILIIYSFFNMIF